MKKIFAFYAILAVAVFVLNGFVTQASNQDSFWTEAARSGMAGAAPGNLALQKAQSQEVKQFAQKMVTGQTAASDELKSLAAGKNVTLPSEMSARQKASLDKLSALPGADFDKAFMKQMVKDQAAAVKLFQRQADKSADADVKAFAAKTLPTLQGHLQLAPTINDGMKNTRSGNSNSNNSNSNMR